MLPPVKGRLYHDQDRLFVLEILARSNRLHPTAEDDNTLWLSNTSPIIT